MRLKTSYIVVLGILGAVALYFVVGSLFGGKHEPADDGAKAAVQATTVQAKMTPEVPHEYDVVIRGRTEAARTVAVASETAGVVAETPAVEGAFVRKGAILCRIAVNARKATLDQAKADLRARELTQQATIELAKKGYRSQTQVLQNQAALDSATAAVRQAEIALDQVNIRAPFDGVFTNRNVEVGSYLGPGQTCGTVIELDPILIVGDLPETEAGAFSVGAPAIATLVSGEKLSGKVRYAARDADDNTRTYHIEVIAQNPRLAARSGLSAEVHIRAGVGPAHLVPVSSLVLDAAGRQGVRYVKADSTVAFAPVTVLEETPDGIWVKGLHGPTNVITVGQSYVGEGQKVQVAAAR